MAWSYDDYFQAPAEMVDEIVAKMSGREQAEREREREDRMKARRG